MKKQTTRWISTLALSAVLGLGAAQTAQAGPFDGILGKAIKVGGIGFLVKQFGPEINKAINTLLQQKGVRYEGRTKVVPTFAIGNGAYVGGAQVQGDEDPIKKVGYVAQVEIPLDRFRGKAYFPVRSLIREGSVTNPVKGAGVTAIIDFRI